MIFLLREMARHNRHSSRPKTPDAYEQPEYATVFLFFHNWLMLLLSICCI